MSVVGFAHEPSMSRSGTMIRRNILLFKVLFPASNGYRTEVQLAGSYRLLQFLAALGEGVTSGPGGAQSTGRIAKYGFGIAFGYVYPAFQL